MLHGAELLLSPTPLDDWEETSKLFWHFPWIAQEFVLGNFNEVSLRFEEYVFYTKGTTPRAPLFTGTTNYRERNSTIRGTKGTWICVVSPKCLMYANL